MIDGNCRDTPLLRQTPGGLGEVRSYSNGGKVMEDLMMEDMEDDAPETPPVRKAAIHSPNTSPLPLAAEAQVEDMPVEDVPAKAAPAEAAPVQPSAESSAKDAPEPKAKGKAKAKAKGKLDCPSGNERKRKKLVGGLEHFFIFPHIGNNYPAVRRELRS